MDVVFGSKYGDYKTFVFGVTTAFWQNTKVIIVSVFHVPLEVLPSSR